MSKWTTANIRSQRGRTAIVTGTGGLGFEDALALARAGAGVVLAGRNADKGMAAARRIRELAPVSSVGFMPLDLANLDSVAAFCDSVSRAQDRIDLLINNAGVMTPPKRQTTKDGFELQLGTNYLGHFALTAGLLPLLRKADRARVVTVSSIAARNGQIDFDDLQSERSYVPMKAYAQSKLACLVFALELHRRSEAGNWRIDSIGVHPGVSRTDLLPNGAGASSAAGLARRYLWFLFQPVAQGALPTLYAATSPQVRSGAYYGPDKLSETRGYPTTARIPAQALDLGVAGKLWSISERLTGIRFGAED